MNLPLPSSFPATSFPASRFRAEPETKLRVYLIGDAHPVLTFYDAGNRRRWSDTRTILANHFDCDEDDDGWFSIGGNSWGGGHGLDAYFVKPADPLAYKP